MKVFCMVTPTLMNRHDTVPLHLQCEEWLLSSAQDIMEHLKTLRTHRSQPNCASKQFSKDS